MIQLCIIVLFFFVIHLTMLFPGPTVLITFNLQSNFLSSMPRFKILLINYLIKITFFLPLGFVCQDPLLKQMRSDKAGFDPAVKNHKSQVKKQQLCIMLMFSHKFTHMTACNY